MRFITLATTAIIAATATAQEASDTLASVKGAREITVTRSQEGLHAVVEGSADDPAYYYEYTTKYSDNGTESGTWTLNRGCSPCMVQTRGAVGRNRSPCRLRHIAHSRILIRRLR